MELLRHLYTRAERGALGKPGFQTVACSPRLDRPRREWIEELVSRAAPAAGSGEVRYLLHPAKEVDRCVLSRIEPLAESLDGRPGNYWADSVVLPSVWLAGAGWDLEAATQTLAWYPTGETLPGHGVFELPDETLPDLSAGPPDRLRLIPELVADAEVRQALLASFAAQAISGEEPARPIYVVAEPAALGDLRKLLLLLPLAFPTPLRARSEEGGRRCLRLLTLGGRGALGRPDLLGLSAAELDEVRGQGVLIDLGCGVPPETVGGEAASLAREVDAALVDGDWQRLTELKAPGFGPAPAARAGGAAAPPGRPRVGRRAAPNEALGGRTAQRALDRPFEVYDQVWRERVATEDEVAAVLELLRRDRAELLAVATQEVERQRTAFQAELRRHQDAMQGEIEAGRQGLETTARSLQNELRGEIDKARGELQRVAERLGGEYASRHQEALDDLKRRQREAAVALDAAWKRQAERLDEERRKLGDRIETAGTPDEGLASGEEETAAVGAGASAAERRREGDEPASGWVVPWNDRRLLGVLVGVLAALVIAAAGWVLYTGISAPEGEPPGAARPAVPAADPPPASLVGLLRDGETARQVFAAALGNEALSSAAAAVWLQLALGDGAALDEATSCYLLQTAVRNRQVDRGAVDPLAVDGGCGEGTQEALAAVAAEGGCGPGGWTAQAACLLGDEVLAGRQGCALRWPVEPTCRLRHPEASRLLVLARRAHVLDDGMDRGALDPAFNPDLVATLPDTLSEDDALALVPLAYLLERAAAEPRRAPPLAPWPERLSAEDLARTEEHVRLADAAPRAEEGGAR